MSIKLSALGQLIDEQSCYARMRDLMQLARECGQFMRIDMENSPYTDDTLTVYRKLRDEGIDNVGVVLQAINQLLWQLSYWLPGWLLGPLLLALTAALVLAAVQLGWPWLKALSGRAPRGQPKATVMIGTTPSGSASPPSRASTSLATSPTLASLVITSPVRRRIRFWFSRRIDDGPMRV